MACSSCVSCLSIFRRRLTTGLIRLCLLPQLSLARRPGTRSSSCVPPEAENLHRRNDPALPRWTTGTFPVVKSHYYRENPVAARTGVPRRPLKYIRPKTRKFLGRHFPPPLGIT